MKQLFLTLGALLFCQCLHAQQVQIRDLETNEPIPFVKVSCENDTVLADIDGYFYIGCFGKHTLFQSGQYRDTSIVMGDQTIIYMYPSGDELEEVYIPTEDEEANRIMTIASTKRRSNHPNGKVSYKYTGYSKFLFTLNPDALANISDTVTDTSLVKMKQFFGSQHLFLMESTSNRYFDPPFREKEEITAYKISGFKDPTLSTFASELQTFHFYENQFTLLGNVYLSPLAFGNVRRYRFQLIETIVNAPGDTTFQIRFRPRVDKDFEGMKGEIFINSRNFAIEKVIASPAEPSENLNATIVQEYQYKDGRWFPSKLSTEASFPSFKVTSDVPDAYMVAKGATYIENLQFGIDLKKEKFNAATVITKDDAADKDSTHWNKERAYALTDKDRRTYEVIDSVSDIYHFDRKLKYLSALLDGKLPLGYVQLDLKRLFNYHEYEGYRFGLGLENSPKLMKRVTIGGYGAYGNRDKAWKYGTYLRANLVPKQFIGLEMRYQDDIYGRGLTSFAPQNGTLQINSIYEDFYLSQMDRQRIAEVAFTGYFRPTLGWRVGTSYQRLWFTRGYEFTKDGVIYDKLDQHEITGELTWSIGEKVTYLAGKRISTGSNKPKFKLGAAIGLKGMEQSTLNYQRVFFEVTERIQLRAAGLLQMKLSARQTFGEVPLFFMNVANGTGGRQWNLSVPNTFETMPASTYYQDKLLALYFRYTTKPLKTNLKWTAPKLSAHMAMGTGTFNTKATHTITSQSMAKGYYESGLIAENVLILNSTGLGIGAFVPYGTMVSPNLSKTLTLKIALNIVLN